MSWLSAQVSIALDSKAKVCLHQDEWQTSSLLTSHVERAEDAPVIRRLFSSSPKDPRYHMLAHISDKFRQPRKSRRHEPRAALFLNRFTRTLTIMYATSGLEEVLGIPAEQMRGRSFYYCISENCLVDSVKCLENAKANDSIAYLRFWFRDPRQDDQTSEDEPDDSDEEMTTDTSVDQDVGGGVQLDGHGGSMDVEHRREANPRRTSNPQSTHEAVFGGARLAESPNSSLPLPPTGRSQSRQHSGNERSNGAIELEAVISCTSDGLVVCLRRARPLLPTRQNQYNENGIFAAPWATEPIVPPIAARPQPAYAHDFAPALSPHAPDHVRVGGPEQDDFMASIREQAIFAWALTGINGSLHKFGYGKPTGDSVPFDGLPVWESDPSISGEIDLIRNDSGPTGWDEMPKGRGGQARERDIFGDPGLDRDRQSASSGGSGSGS